MAGLQRSAVSFRRQGSSGFVWDDKLISEELNKVNEKQDKAGQEQDHEKAEIKEIKTTRTVGSVNTIERSRSNGGGRVHRTAKITPAIEPPSPRLSACGCCSAFGKQGNKGHRRTKAGKPRSR
ncbi:MAPK kinase substrate protein [Quillaja saponaria]|uniref:MAPK kinase substrate protein n=1 Tax=Quillaja saponaria TaxID=32244 RepID=A0AAD7LT27_QUISA|nr:MAPK kinase substrate protein [Quillaja saponaria]